VTSTIYQLNEYQFRYRYGEGIDVMAEDWDNLLLMDAGRYDILQSILDADEGNLGYRISKGCYTWEFMRENFQGRTLHDTVYVSANPHCVKLDPDTFHKLIYLEDEWDPEIHTVHPSAVNEAVDAVAEEFDDKRILVHYMQPHAPYFGEQAERLKEQVPVKLHGWHKYHMQDGKDSDLEGLTWNEAVEDGYLSWEQIRALYRGQYETVLEYATELGRTLSGKSVLSSDHGELLGERLTPVTLRESGHRVGLDTPALLQVPWLDLDGTDERRSITSEPPVESDVDVDYTVIEDRLAALGYTE
jgi:hypothetical protein